MTVTIYTLLTAFSWAGGPDVVDVAHAWRVAYVTVPGYDITYVWPPRYQSQRHCEVNLPLSNPPPGSYGACLPETR